MHDGGDTVAVYEEEVRHGLLGRVDAITCMLAQTVKVSLCRLTFPYLE